MPMNTVVTSKPVFSPIVYVTGGLIAGAFLVYLFTSGALHSEAAYWLSSEWSQVATPDGGYVEFRVSSMSDRGDILNGHSACGGTMLKCETPCTKETAGKFIEYKLEIRNNSNQEYALGGNEYEVVFKDQLGREFKEEDSGSWVPFGGCCLYSLEGKESCKWFGGQESYIEEVTIKPGFTESLGANWIEVAADSKSGKIGIRVLPATPTP